MMKRRVGTYLKIIIVLVIAIWAIDKMPFSKDIKQEVSANVYLNGAVTEQITISMDGVKTNYLFAPNSFQGNFYIPLIEATKDGALQASIEHSRNRDEHAQYLLFNQNTTFVLAEDMGIVPYVLINDSMTQFAIMLTDGRVIATTAELQQLYRKHITWHPDTSSVTITAANQIPDIN